MFFFSRFQPVRKIFFWVSVTRGSVCFMSSLETFEGFFVASLFKHYKQYSVFFLFVFVLFVVFAVIVFIPLTFLLL